MIANADLLDYEDEDEENHLDYNIGANQNQNPNYTGFTEQNSNGFQDYKMSSKNSFGDQNDYIAGAKLHLASSIKHDPQQQSLQKSSRSKKQPDEEDEFLDEIINRNYGVKSNKAPPAVNF